MARSKSTPGSKTTRTSATPTTNASNEQSSAAIPVNPPAVSTAAATTPAEKAAETKLTPETRVKPEARIAAEPRTAPEMRKFEVLKTEPRKNVLPINLEEEIRRRAFEIYQQRGSGAGHEAEDWFTAEREVKHRYRQPQSA